MYQSTVNISDLKMEAAALVQGEPNLIANLANLSSLVFHSVGELNWCGFYLFDSIRNELVLGPFQGKPACLRIAKGKGVCGTAWSEKRTQNIADVHQIKNHIACDAASRSELVIPLFRGDHFFGVLDLDSPRIERFDKDLAAVLQALADKVITPLFHS